MGSLLRVGRSPRALDSLAVGVIDWQRLRKINAVRVSCVVVEQILL